MAAGISDRLWFDGRLGCAGRCPVGEDQRRGGRGLGKHPLKQNRLIFAPKLDVESDTGHSCHGDFEFNMLDPMLVEP
jgi:hypothetical protein